ncbi:serine hydrolase domain-containing protein [Salipiger bermudensis]|uniref:serine hydrolase domain-containing protein n=1 Tax=Salipiger bermudensis TaxID=344736 RepID=UPI001CD5F5D9|nr:serine hydrolase [Salipiger bermudensis]MCA0963844.1 serine hydrolase [Salipiger bermudensis]
MLSRRTFAFALAGGLAAPSLLRAQQGTDAIRDLATNLEQLHSIQVRRGDETLLAEAPRGPGLARVANIKSCSKSLLALILGAVIDAGGIESVEARLGDVAPVLIPAGATEGVEDLTMRDLVTLRAGLERTSGANYGAWVSESNWVAYVLRQPRVAENGGPMIYSTGTTHVLGAAIATATGDSLLTLARRHLGTPLGVSIPPWTRDPQGFYFGGNEMALTPEAMLRVAVAMRDGGRYEGTQVLPADWVAASQEARTRSRWSGLGYGYGWFLSDSGWTLGRGYGGQIIAAHPERDLAVAITSDPTRPARSDGYFGDLMRLLNGPILALG